MSKGWTFKKVLSGKIRVQPAKQWFRQQIKGFATFGLLINWQAWEFSHQRIGSYTVSIEDSGLVGPCDTANNEPFIWIYDIWFYASQSAPKGDMWQLGSCFTQQLEFSGRTWICPAMIGTCLGFTTGVTSLAAYFGGGICYSWESEHTFRTGWWFGTSYFSRWLEHVKTTTNNQQPPPTMDFSLGIPKKLIAPPSASDPSVTYQVPCWAQRRYG